MSLHSPLSLLTSHFSLLSSLTSLLSFPSKSHCHSFLPTHHHPKTFLVGAGDELAEALEDPVGCAVAGDEFVEAVAFLTGAGLWVVLWVCDLFLYSNGSTMGL